MERLTVRSKTGNAYFPKCFDGCDGVCGKCKNETDYCEKLAAYEDAEEQGLLIRLPCKVGGGAYCIEIDEDVADYSVYKYLASCGDYMLVTPKYMHTDDFEEQLAEMEEESTEWCGTSINIFHKRFIFFTKEEAEKALERMNNGS